MVLVSGGFFLFLFFCFTCACVKCYVSRWSDFTISGSSMSAWESRRIWVRVVLGIGLGLGLGLGLNAQEMCRA